MIGRIAFQTRTINSGLRSCNIQQFRNPNSWSRWDRFKDATANLIDGYKPMFVKGLDKKTGKKYSLRDNSGRRLVNWVRTIKQGEYTIKDILNFNGTKIIETKDKNNLVVEKFIEKSLDTDGSLDKYYSVFENGNVKYAAKKSGQTDTKTIWLDKDSFLGSWNRYKFVKSRMPETRENIATFCDECCPELKDFMMH